MGVLFMRKSLILLLICSILLTSCTTSNAPAPPPSQTVSNVQEVEKPKFTKDTYPKVDGSTATIPLSEAIASSILQISNIEANTLIKHNTTHNAYVNLINNSADIIFVTEPSKEELNLAKEAKVELEIIPIVKEGFVFLVNTKNPVNSLTIKQIQDIYQGKINNWSKVGGEEKDIIAYQREPNSGSQTLMEQLVMKGLTLADHPKTLVYGMEGLIESIAKYDNSEKALGYSVFYYAKTMYNKDTIKLLAIDDIAANNKNIASGKYPFTTAYYAVLKKNTASDAPSRKLLKWILGNDGQKLAEECGYVPLEVK